MEAAVRYYRAHPEEIDRLIEENERAREDWERLYPHLLPPASQWALGARRMRLWLDEMIPGEVARRLRDSGHDVQGVQEGVNRWAWGLEDREQLDVAVRQGRALLTDNLRDFIPISREWAEAGRTHLGIVLAHPRTVGQQDVGELLRRLASLLATAPDEGALRDRVVFL